jgi:hypothetical protein
MFIALYDSDIFKEYEGKVSFVMQNTPQPWHPQGVYLHEVALAVKVHQPELFAKVVRAIYEAFAFGKGKFTDADTYDKSRAQIYEEALDVAASAGADRALIAEKVKLLTLKPAPGVEVQATTSCTQDIKWAVKRQRKMGVHVTPTVFINGLEAGIAAGGNCPLHLSEDIAPCSRLLGRSAQAAPTHPGAPPPQRRGSPRPQSLASACAEDEPCVPQLHRRRLQAS